MCPDRGILSAYFDGEVDAKWSGEISGHLQACVNCRSYVNELEAQRKMLHSLLVPDFKDSLEFVKSRIREKGTVSRSMSFWERKVPLSAVAALLLAVITLGVHLFVAGSLRNNGVVVSSRRSVDGERTAMSDKKFDEILRMMEANQKEEFSPNSIVELPPNISLIFNGESQLIRPAGFKGESF